MDRYNHTAGLVGDWTVERLDSLPEHTVIEWGEDGRRLRAVRIRYLWVVAGEATVYYSEGVVEDASPHSIQVVSVSVETLLSNETMSAVQASQDDEMVIRDAVTHIIGETNE